MVVGIFFFNCLLFNLLMIFFLASTSSNARSARITLTTTSSTPTPPAPSDLQTQLHDTRSLLTDHNERVRVLEGVITEHDAIRWEVRLLRQLVEKTGGDRGSELVGVGAASDYSDNDDIARSIRTIVPHESESVEEGDGDQMARKHQRDEKEEEERRRRAEIARLRTPVEPHRQPLCY